jgi:hypothetical protein
VTLATTKLIAITTAEPNAYDSSHALQAAVWQLPRLKSWHLPRARPTTTLTKSLTTTTIPHLTTTGSTKPGGSSERARERPADSSDINANQAKYNSNVHYRSSSCCTPWCASPGHVITLSFSSLTQVAKSTQGAHALNRETSTPRQHFLRVHAVSSLRYGCGCRGQVRKRNRITPQGN